MIDNAEFSTLMYAHTHGVHKFTHVQIYIHILFTKASNDDRILVECVILI